MSPANLSPSPKPAALHRQPSDHSAGHTLDHRTKPGQDDAAAWAVAVIIPCPLPPRLRAQPQPVDPAALADPMLYIGAAPIYGPPPYGNGSDDYEALYAPPEARFALVIDPGISSPGISSPGTSATGSTSLRWQDVEIVLRSPQAWAVDPAAPSPPVTPALIGLVHDLARQAQALGWRPDGRGPHWYSLRFRRPWAELGGTQHRG